MPTLLVEVVLDATALLAAGIDGRDEIEDALSEALVGAGLGQVTGGGGGSGLAMIDIEVDAEEIDASLAFIVETLRKLGAPAGTVVNARGHRSVTT